MSSSGKGQSLVRKKEDLEKAWQNAMEGSRGKSELVIVEEFISLQVVLVDIKFNVKLALIIQKIQ